MFDYLHKLQNTDPEYVPIFEKAPVFFFGINSAMRNNVAQGVLQSFLSALSPLGFGVDKRHLTYEKQTSYS